MRPLPHGDGDGVVDPDDEWILGKVEYIDDDAGVVHLDGCHSAGVDMRLDADVVGGSGDGLRKLEVLLDAVLCLAPRRRESDANGENRLAVLPDRDGRRRSVRAGGGVCIMACGWNATASACDKIKNKLIPFNLIYK